MKRANPSRSVSPLLPSVFDRLLGQDAPSDAQMHAHRASLIRQLKASLQRDLQNLLNTRRRCGGFPAEWTELETSLVNYGIPDFTGADVGSAGSREEFLRVIRAAIERFEPRLANVALFSLENEKEPLARALRFRIEAVLVTEHEQEPVAFLSTMEPASGSYRIERE